MSPISITSAVTLNRDDDLYIRCQFLTRDRVISLAI